MSHREGSVSMISRVIFLLLENSKPLLALITETRLKSRTIGSPQELYIAYLKTLNSRSHPG